MNARPFLDTNVLVYAFTTDDGRKDVARRLIAAGAVVSVQVLNEFANVSRRKLGRDWQDIRAFLGLLRGRLGRPGPVDVETHEKALELSERHRLPIYDSLILAAAWQAGCPILYSEDMQHGRTIEGVSIVNPFLDPSA